MAQAKLRQLFPEPFIWARAVKLFYSGRSHLVQSGYVESIRRRHPCDAQGSPLPWMNYAVVFFLEQRLQPDHTLFEYGSGFSTRFYARRVSHVTSVEHDRGWFDKGKEDLPPNVELLHVDLNDGDRYVNAIQGTGRQFDIVIIDGRQRERSALAAVASLTPGGVIIFDDSDRERYQAARGALRESGFRVIDFRGLKPGGMSAHQTSIFYRDDNCLGI